MLSTLAVDEHTQTAFPMANQTDRKVKDMAHTLPPLPYAEDALAPVISAETISYHYGKHHKSYVDTLNRLIAGTAYENKSLEDIIRSATGGIFNNAAQVYNHTFY